MVEKGSPVIKNEMSSSSSSAATFTREYGGGNGDGEGGSGGYEDGPGKIFGHSQWQADGDDERRRSNLDNLYGRLLSSSEEDDEDIGGRISGGGAGVLTNISSLFSSTIAAPTASYGDSVITSGYLSNFDGGGGGGGTSTGIPLEEEVGVHVNNEPLPWSTWVLVTFFTSLIVVTIVGNLLVCLSVILVRKLRKPQNYLLVSLAISDLFVAIFVMPFAVSFDMYGGTWPFNNSLCDLWVSGKIYKALRSHS